jgi:hypothetical protein
MITIADLLDALNAIESASTHFALAVATVGSRKADAGTRKPRVDDQRHALDELLKALNTKVRPCMDEARQQPPFDAIAALEWTTKRLTADPDLGEHDHVCLAQALEALAYAKSHVDTNLLAVARQTLALWDKYGMGDEEEDSEPVYHLLKDAVNGYDYWRSRHDKPCPF